MPTRRPTCARAFACLVLLASGVIVMSAAMAQAPTATSALPRQHPLELEALTAPEKVLARLPGAREEAAARGDTRTLALLALAEANACRVTADWACQRSAGERALQLAEVARDPLLQVRGLIAQSRAAIALQDYTPGEQLLARAEVLLRENPDAELAGDVFLAYSSLSYSLGKHGLALDYARRGLEALPAGQALPMRVRLLRNYARAAAQLGQIDVARARLGEALTAVASLGDPKLTAEIHLETARLAREDGDIDAQRDSGRAILELAANLRNSQLEGLGHEVLGLAEQGAGDFDEARRQLARAVAAFRALGLDRDESRGLRELLAVELRRGASTGALAPRLERYFDLEQQIATSDRAIAADDFEARLRYAAQEIEVQRLAAEAALAAEREQALAEQSRLRGLLTFAAGAAVLALLGLLVVQRRATQRVATTLAQLRDSESRATELLRVSSGYVYLHDSEGRLISANPAVAEVLGLGSDELIGRRLSEFAADDGYKSYLTRVLRDRRAEGIAHIRAADGTTRHWRYSTRVAGADPQRPSFVVLAVDVSAQVSEASTLREQSEHDALTGVYNRRRIDQFEREQAAGKPWGVVAIDLDGFKQVNDTYGHERGDEVLVAFARFLLARTRAGDAVVRMGGDEFAILMREADAQRISALLARLDADRAQAPCAYSLGSALRDGDEPLAETLTRADREMYARRSVIRAATAPA